MVSLQNLLLIHSSNSHNEAGRAESCKYRNNSIWGETWGHGGTDQLMLLLTPIGLNAGRCSRSRRPRLDSDVDSPVWWRHVVGFIFTNLYFYVCYIFQSPLYSLSRKIGINRKLSILPAFLTNFQWNYCFMKGTRFFPLTGVDEISLDLGQCCEGSYGLLRWCTLGDV